MTSTAGETSERSADEALCEKIAALRSFLHLGKWDAALSVADGLAQAHPDDGDIIGLVGIVHATAGNHERARSLLAKAPGTVKHLTALASACLKLGDVQGAEDAARRCLAIDGSDATARQLLEIARSRRRDADEARVRSTHEATPDLPAFAALRRGDLVGGLELLAAMLVDSDLPGALFVRALSRRVPRWDGSPVGHLLVVASQGYGDAMQFVRWCFAARERVREMTIVARPELVRLFSRSGLNVVDAARFNVLLGAADAQTEAMLLPLALGASYGPAGGYLRCATVPASAGGPLRVGVCWRAGTDARSATLQALEPLRDVPGVEYVNLTRHAEASPWMAQPKAGDFAETADIIGGLHLVISVDTAVAHLAGALGKPVWIALPRHADWRWQTGERTPWYRSARLFRGDLDTRSFAHVADALSNEVTPWAISEELFTSAECERIREYLCTLPAAPGRVASGESRIFVAQQSMVRPSGAWFEQRLLAAAERASTRLGVRAPSLLESGHFLRYGLGGKFDWHRDDNGEGTRVLSLTLQLSDPSDYEGGEMIVNAPNGARRVCADRTQGVATFFRSECLHAVAPIARGERQALVHWLAP